MKCHAAFAVLAALLAGCATTPSAIPSASPATQAWSDPAKEVAILAVVDRFLLAIGNHDDGAMKDLLIAEGVTFFQQSGADGFGKVRPFPNSSMLEAAPDGADPFIERYWDPVVLIRGGMAQVWAPYELRDNGQVVHCGIDGFQLVDLDGAWRVAHVVSTMEPDACDDIGPTSIAAMRPRDGWKETPLQ